jgi:hypothetical protein
MAGIGASSRAGVLLLIGAFLLSFSSQGVVSTNNKLTILSMTCGLDLLERALCNGLRYSAYKSTIDRSLEAN